MAIRKIPNRSSGKRIYTMIDYSASLTTNKPLKSLTTPLKSTGGRNNSGKITVRSRGGGNKKRYRVIDFKRDKDNVPAIIKTIEYDPNRNSFISLIFYADGEKRYIVAPEGIKVGDQVVSGDSGIDLKIGNCLPVKNIARGSLVHNIELVPGRGAQIVRSAGGKAQILGQDSTGQLILIKLPSKEIRKIKGECRAVIGQVSNSDYGLINWGKAGKRRHLGFRPTVRGSAMNPNDHVHGGGEGRCPIGRDAPRTPWGKRCMGVKTRKGFKYSDKFIVSKFKSKR